MQIVEQHARWTSLAGIDDLGEGHPPYFLISGSLRNDDARPARFVKLRYELLDDAGNVIASEYGYNHLAEDLRSPEYDGRPEPDEVEVTPLPAGASDTFRMLFFRADVPRFSAWRVHIVEVRPGLEPRP